MQFIKSKRNKELLVIENFKFTFQKRLANNEERWKCTKRGCRAYIKMNDKLIVEQQIVHNGHESEKESYLVRQKLTDALAIVAESDLTEQLIRKEIEIARKDPCDFCLCIDSEMFCYWQPELCLSPSPNNETTTHPTQAQNISKAITVTELSGSEGMAGSDPSTQWSTTKSDETQTTELPSSTEQISTAQPNFCSVLGVEYKLGEILPRDTGSCLQCQCTYEARIACTPKNCVSISQDYSHDASNSLDMFDVDVF